ncbi:MAG: Gfo/Idh/MocA family protein [Puniceicoccaceae bacterium]
MSTTNPIYRCAVIGTGKAQVSSVKGGGHQIGYAHANFIRRNPRLELAAAADINPENLAAFQDKFELAEGFGDYREMLEKTRPDVVSICTYLGLHGEMVLACAEAGVQGVFLEKPAFHSPAAFARASEAIERTGLKLCLAHQRRHLPNIVEARRLIAGGAIGRPLMFQGGIQDWDLSEMGSHWLDIMRFLNDDRPILWVMAQGRVTGQRGYGHLMEDHAVATFEFDNGARGYLDGGKRLGQDVGEDDKHPDMPPTLSVSGTEGVLHLRQWFKHIDLTNADGHRRITADTGGDIGEDYATSWEPFANGMVAWLDGGEAPPAGWPHARGTAELNLAAYVSMLRGDRIDLPMDEAALALDEWPLETLARERSI